MTPSDWITIVTSVIATIAAVLVSWRLYQLQQAADLRQLSERIKELSDKYDSEKKITEKVDEIENLVSIREKVAKIDGQLNAAVESITKAIDSQQTVLEKSIHSKIVTHLNKARKEFEESVRRELQQKLVSSEDQDKIASDLVEVFIHTTQTLTNIRSDETQETEQIKAELRIKRPLNEVKEAMHELRDLVDLPKLLNGPSQERNKKHPVIDATAKHQKN